MDTKFEGTADDLKEKGERDFDQDDFKLGDGYEKLNQHKLVNYHLTLSRPTEQIMLIEL